MWAMQEAECIRGVYLINLVEVWLIIGSRTTVETVVLRVAYDFHFLNVDITVVTVVNCFALGK